MESTSLPPESTNPDNAEPDTHAIELLERVARLEGSLNNLQFILAHDANGESLRIKALHQINDYLEPRIKNLNAPLLAVVGGSTGAGKSTLVNSLLGDRISRSGAVRPTTRTPVLAVNPADEPWFANERILPELTRLKGAGYSEGHGMERHDALLVVPHNNVPRGLAILDAPDIDSVSDDNRALAGQLLNAADLWIFVTTANRYADAIPWEVLTEAGGREITVCVILNRVPAGAETDIVPDLQRLLAAKNLDPKLLHVINEVPLDEQQMIPGERLEPISAWLNSLAANAAERQRIAEQTLEGAIKRLQDDVRSLGEQAEDQDLQLQSLAKIATERFEFTLGKTTEALKDGSLLRGEILARWQDFVGAGELLRGIEGVVGRIRDRVGSFFSGKPPATHRVEDAIESGIHAVLVVEITNAFHDVDRSWRNTPIGIQLLSSLPALRPPKELETRAADTIRAWQKDVLEMIRSEGAGKRKTARIAAFGVNGVAVALMVVVFASTAGVTGLEVGIAGGSAVVGQKLLEAIFGEDAVRRMATRARTMLESRTQELIDENLSMYLNEIDAHLQPEIVQELLNQVKPLRGGGYKA
ncbi:GTPase domain-containing protein [Arthrobacter sp. MYb213]|uniref:dynamin family protein n=1 Tax=Arthrobacter sp. MYb213 TaxID=1848595 RepID=UPI000CFBC270|nr:GTPase domain-containing protein [Arthrobacter sp. MYb213]PRB72718.1 ABC transporter [Arthrobacter sp. MYb213]